MYVQSEEKKIVFGARRKWADVEADEVDLGKEEVAKSVKSRGKVQWEQWGGLVERGCPKHFGSLSPSAKADSQTRPRSRIATKHLAHRKVILHTDGARAYKLKVPDVIHDNVVRKKKLVKIKGKATWVKPHYTTVYKHNLPDGKQVVVKAGAQIIDRF